MSLRRDWPALVTASVVVVLVNAVAYTMGLVVFMTILAVPLALVAAAGVNYALYDDPLLQLRRDA